MRTSRPELLLLSCLILLGSLTAEAQTLTSPLRQAQACYARDDLGCVIDAIGPNGAALTDDARAKATIDRFIADLEAQAANGAGH